MGYDFGIEYKKGHDNRAADALSRQQQETLLALSSLVPSWIEPIQQEVQDEPDLIKLTQEIQQQHIKGPW
jgi:hypothetical protein